MKGASVLVIGGGIGGLTAAIAMRRQGFDVEVIERDPTWSVYGVGIIQQSNVVRAMKDLDILDEYLDNGWGFDYVDIFLPNGQRVARVPSPKLVPGYPANVGIGRRALHKVLGDRTIASGATVRLGVTATSFDDDGEGVSVTFSDGVQRRYDLVVGADGINSTTRDQLFPDASEPNFAGQSVWRYNLERPAEVEGLWVFDGPTGVGLVPLSPTLMYIYVTTPEPDNPRYPVAGLAATMRAKLAELPPIITELAEQITIDEDVVYKPLYHFFLEGAWHRGRVVLLGDAVHATTPHLGQGAGMAIEDSIVLAEELAKASSPEEAFVAFEARRLDRCRYIVEQSLAICHGQIGKGPRADNARATQEMFEVVAEPI